MSWDADKENLYNNLEPLQLVIISNLDSCFQGFLSFMVGKKKKKKKKKPTLVVCHQNS